MGVGRSGQTKTWGKSGPTTQWAIRPRASLPCLSKNDHELTYQIKSREQDYQTLSKLLQQWLAASQGRTKKMCSV